MVNNKATVKENVEEIKNILENEKLQRYLVKIFYKGIDNYKKSQELDKGNSIDSYTISKGIEKARKIGNAICNDENCTELGIKTDVILGCKIPIIKIGNIAMTIKSFKNVENILKSNTEYIKEFSRVNDKLNLQTNMLDLFNEESYDNTLNAKYYCVLAYNFSQGNILTYMNFIFLDEKTDSIVLKIKVPESILNPQNKITHRDPSTVNESNINGNSLKNLLRIK